MFFDHLVDWAGRSSGMSCAKGPNRFDRVADGHGDRFIMFYIDR